MKCTVVINDEVNCQISGLPVEIRRDLVKQHKYDLPYARHLPNVRLGRWDGKIPFFQLSGSTYINLLPGICEYLDQKHFDIELEDNRTYNTSFEFEAVNENSFSHKVWPVGHMLAGQPIVLRDYQVTVIGDYLNNTQCLQAIATGAGKCLSGNTIMSIDFDETTPFGMFMINKLQKEQGNDVTDAGDIEF